jgi:hypothetical protein
MGIKTELDALRRRMVEDVQRDITIMSEVADVFGEIDVARQNGYQRLARVFAGDAPAQPQALQSEDYGPTPPQAALNPDRRAFLEQVYGTTNLDDILRAEGPPLQYQPYPSQQRPPYANGAAPPYNAAPSAVAQRFAPNGGRTDGGR